MKYAFAAIALAAVARAQTLADIPSCALPCLDKSIADNTSCDKTDLACVCKNFDKVQGDATACVLKECGSDVAINDVLPAAQKLCENPPAESSAAAVTTTSAAAVETTSSAAEKPAETTSAAYEAPSKPVESASVKPTPAPMPTVVEPPKQPTTTPVHTAGAASLGSMGGLAMLVLGAFAL